MYTLRKIESRFTNLLTLRHKMPESQQHGNIWEDSIKRDVYHITQRIPYTAKYDIPKEYNTRNQTENVSIKTTQMKSVDMGDALRMYQNSEPTSLLVIRYKQVEDKKRLSEIVHCQMPPTETLFGSVSLEEVQTLDRMIKAVPKGKADDTVMKSIHEYKDTLNKKSGYAHLRPKIDSQSQRRLQCSIVDFEGLLQNHPSLIRERNTEGKLYDVEIPLELESCRRQRNS